MNTVEMLNNAQRSGIQISDGNNESLSVRGNAFVRDLSCEVEWEEIDRESGAIKKYNSILSKLGWQWEKHWNVYTEDAPFGLMLSELFGFLSSCIKCNNNIPSFIEWGWDVRSFFLINIKPVEGHLWHRCLIEFSIQDYGRIELIKDVLESSYNNFANLISQSDAKMLDSNESLFIIRDDRAFLNGDLVCFLFKIIGCGGRIGNSPKIKYNLIQSIKSFSIRLKMIKSGLFKEISYLNYGRTIWEDTGEEISK